MNSILDNTSEPERFRSVLFFYIILAKHTYIRLNPPVHMFLIIVKNTLKSVLWQTTHRNTDALGDCVLYYVAILLNVLDNSIYFYNT